MSLYGGLYVLIIILTLLLALVKLVDKSDDSSFLVVFAFIAIYGIVFIPIISFYSSKIFMMRNKSESYKSLIGVIRSIDTPQFIRSDHRNLNIKVDELNETIYAKIYKGELYDEVAKGIKIEIAYNEKNGDIIVLNVI